MKKAIRMAALGLCMAMALAGCGSKKINMLEQVQKDGILKVAVTVNCPPYSSEEPAGSGSYDGIEIELAEKLAAQLGVTLELVPMEKEELQKNFVTQGAQMAIGRIAESDSVRYSYPATIPYLTGRLYVVTPIGVYLPTLSCFTDTKLGATSQLSDDYRVLVSGTTNSGVEYYKNSATVAKGLYEGGIAGYICYEEQAKEFLKNPHLQVQSVYDAPCENYIAIAAPGGEGLVEQTNLVIGSLAEPESQPE